MDRSEVFEELRRRGVARVEVEFSGGNDEGGVDAISLLDGDGKVVQELNEYHVGYAWNHETKRWEEPPPPTVDQVLSQALARPVYERYGSFAGEFRVRGKVEWDVAAGKVKMDGEEMDYRGFDEDL